MNILAIIAAAIVPMILGSIWYSMKVFGKVWLRGIGKDPSNPAHMEQLKKGAPRAMTISLLMSLLSAIVLSSIFDQFGIVTVKDAFCTTLTIWAGFTFAVMLTHAAYEMKDKKYFLVQASYQLLSAIGMALALILL
ncbi:MAG: DUF1761 domain-containing protein [Candidatus Paceibacterota bacterium]